jgi:lysophospholipase L1-like esterase
MGGKKVLDAVVIVISLAIAAWVYMGFFHPDPYFTEDIYFPRIKTILHVIQAIFPVLALLMVWLYIAVRRGKIAGSHIALAGGTIIFGALVLYPFANSFFQSRYFSKVELFHPYLQLTPHDLELKPGDRSGKYVIVCLGGSTTEFKGHNGEGWTDLLERDLKDAVPGKTVEVYNEGRQWYTMQHSLINYEINVRPKKPDMIIVMQSINDLSHNADFAYFSHGPFRDDYGHFYGPINRVLERPGLLGYCLHSLKSYWYHKPREVVDTDTFPGLVSYENKLKSIIDLAQHDSTKVVVMSEAFLFKEPITDEERAALYMISHETIGPTKQWSLGTAIRGMNAYNNVCRRVAEERHLPFVDLETQIPKTLDYFYDEVHFNDTAHVIVANAIASTLRNTVFAK